MQKKHLISVYKNEGRLAIDFTVMKDENKLVTLITASKQVHNTNMYSRSASDFRKDGLVTDVKRFTPKALQVHLDWIEANKEQICEEVLAFYGLSTESQAA